MFDRFTTKKKEFCKKNNKQIEKIYHITIEYLKINLTLRINGAMLRLHEIYVKFFEWKNKKRSIFGGIS